MAEVASKSISKSTLFVSTIPFDATKEQLEQFFSKVGPIKSCFIIKKDGNSTGCGYVQFALSEDAEKALKSLKKIKFEDKRTLKIEWAIKKSIVRERKEAGLPLKDKQTKELEKLKEKIKKPKLQTMKRQTCVVLSDLPKDVSKKQIFKKAKKFGNVKEVTFPYEERNLPLIQDNALIEYENCDEAKKAFSKLDQHIFKGNTLKCKLVEKISAASIAKKARLIVRNLAFGCKKEHLETVFSVYGPLVECSCPCTNDGKSRGFGFVQFQNIKDAEAAIEGINGSKILNRPVAVDWALSKAHYDRISNENEDAEDQQSESEKGNDLQGESEKEEIEEEISSQADASDNDAAILDEDNEIDQSSEVETTYDNELELQKDLLLSKQSAQERTLFVRNLSFDTTEQTLYNSFKKFGKLSYAKITKDKVTNLSRGNGFVCFADVEAAKKCLKAFEKASLFYETSKTEDAPQTSQSLITPEIPQVLSDKIADFIIDERFISVTESVDKKSAIELTHAGKMKQRAQDKKNAYLMREGVILPGTPAAEGLKPEELEKRNAAFNQRKKLLASNPNLFISKTRLSVRNLGLSITDAKLKNECKYAVINFWKEVEQGKRESLEREVMEEEIQQGKKIPGPDRKVIVKQAKVLKDSDRLDAVTKKPKSKGYGFVEFDSHADALACLRWLNNNEKAFTFVKDGEPTLKTTKRPIIEFAIENNLVLKRRSERNKTSHENKKRKSEETEQPNSKKQKTEKVKPKDRNVIKTPKKVETKSKDKKDFKNKERKESKNKDRKDFKNKKEEKATKPQIAKPVQPQKSLAFKNENRVSKRQLKRTKQRQSEEKFDDLVASYKKRFLDG